jgi:hypothetical protein
MTKEVVLSQEQLVLGLGPLVASDRAPLPELFAQNAEASGGVSTHRRVILQYDLHGAAGLLAILRRAWNDSVWSKVIAAGITAALAAIGSLAVGQWHEVNDSAGALGAALASSVSVPVWLLALLAGSVAALVLALSRRGNLDGDASVDVQPNAVPVARIGQPLLARSFEDLSERQQQFLAQQFRVGKRVFAATAEDRRAPWFDELEGWNYVVPHEPYVSGTSSFEITEAAWRDLERLSRTRI